MGQGDNRPLPYERNDAVANMNTFSSMDLQNMSVILRSRADMDWLTSKLSAHLALGEAWKAGMLLIFRLNIGVVKSAADGTCPSLRTVVIESNDTGTRST